jgi:hypothetical protein
MKRMKMEMNSSNQNKERMEEIRNALQRLKNNKSPGTDHIPAKAWRRKTITVALWDSENGLYQ